MKSIVGIITEYNPFHNGHLYQIKQVKKAFPNAPLVIAMSGNFLQRGEPAIIDKWHRAKECLANGADLVMEMPVLAAVQAADRFAYYGVWTHFQMGVTDLFFGAEHSDYDFMNFAKIVKDIKGDFTKRNESFARSYQRIITEKIGHSVEQPNDLLGLAYAKANLKLNANINLHPIQRKNANYHDMHLQETGTIASASAIRRALFNNDDEIEKFVPAETLSDLLSQRLVSWDDFWMHLKMELLTHNPEELAEIYGMSEGIQYRMIEMANRSETSQNFESWIKAVKNKRFTYTRLSRLAVMTLLHVTKSDFEKFQQMPYLRVLGFTSKGREVLHNAKKKTEFPIITNVSADDKRKIMNVDYKTGKMYQSINGTEQDLKNMPIMFNKE
nr:nucleotidyltransferase [uncultured Ligilactobacillus sp.]